MRDGSASELVSQELFKVKLGNSAEKKEIRRKEVGDGQE